MIITQELKEKLGIALNEAIVLGIELSEEKDLVACTFAVISLDKNGNIPEDNRVQFLFKPAGRVIASLRNGHWKDKDAAVVNFDPKQLLDKVISFNGLSLYGWDFINCGSKMIESWQDRLSFDYNSGQETGHTNTIDLFQEGEKRHLDIRIWFDDFEIFDSQHQPVNPEEFIENGKKAWDAIFAGDEKMKIFGIIPGESK